MRNLASIARGGTKRISTLLSIDAQLRELNHKLDRLERHSHGGRATYMGNNRVLVGLVVADRNIAYYVEADDRLLTPWLIVSGEFETPLTEFFLRELRPDSRCIDVGSNFGYFTCLMARLCPDGRVIGVEADERIYALTRDNIAINGLAHIASAVHAAAGDSGADMTLYRRATRAANTSIIRYDEAFTEFMGEAPSVPFVVRGTRVDDLAAELQGRVDFIKVDVEGAEPLVFAGARRTIADNPQLTIMMEWSPGQIATAGFPLPDFLAELGGMGLDMFDLEPGTVVPVSRDELLNIPYRPGIVLRRRG